MKNFKSMKLNKFQIFSIILFVSLFIILYFNFIINLYILPNNLEIPFISLIGFAIIIIGIFYLFLDINNNHTCKRFIIRFKFINENGIKSLFLIFMIIGYFIPPITFSEVIIDWSQIGYSNYIRVVLTLIGSAFLPGASIYSIIFPKNQFPNKFKVESFLFKITLYPILSFTLLGTFTLLFDFIGLNRELYSIMIFLFIIFLFIFDLLNQKYKNNTKSYLYKNTIDISKSTVFILLISIGVIICALGVHLSTVYLIPGDSWRGINYSYFVCRDNGGIFNKFCGSDYTVYWGYISYSLSVLCGIPYININVLLIIFEYLFVTSSYLFMKGLLGNLKEKYILLSTIVCITFSGLFYVFNSYLGRNNLSALIFDGILNFRYKSFAHVSLILALALFVVISKNSKKSKIKSLLKNENSSAIILIAFLIAQSFIIYFLPFIASLSFLISYSIFSYNKSQTFRLLLSFILYFIVIFIILDIMSIFFFSWISRSLIFLFIGLPLVFNEELLILNTLFLYFAFFCLGAFCYLLNKKDLNHISVRFKCYYKIKSAYLFIIFISLFSILIGIQVIFNILLNFDQNFLTFLLDTIFFPLGIIGILGIYFSYYTFLKDKKLFYVLLFWSCLAYLIASLIIFQNWIELFPLSPQEIPDEQYHNMVYWFSRNWYYAIYPLSIFFSIGILSLKKIIKQKSWIKPRKNLRLINCLTYSSIIIFFSLSNTIIAATEWNNWYSVTDDEAQMMGWISNNIPIGSYILADSNRYNPLDDIIHCTNYIRDFTTELYDALGFDKYNLCYYNQKYINWSVFYIYDAKCEVENIEDLNGQNNTLKFIDNNSNGSTQLNIKFGDSQTNGYINFSFKISNKEFNNFNINLTSHQNDKSVSIILKMDTIYCFNGTKYQNITNIDNDVWYNLKILFETTNNNYDGLDKYQWNLIIDGTKYGQFNFIENITKIDEIKFTTGKNVYNHNSYLTNMSFSWAEKVTDIESLVSKIPIIIKHLIQNNISYFILSESFEERFKAEELTLSFYRNKLFEYGNIGFYYADEI